MKSYLRRLFGLRGLEQLQPPHELVEMRQKLVRESWEKLVSAVKRDFGEKLVDSKTRQWLEARFKSYADEIGYASLSLKASNAIRPCESCVNFKDVSLEDDEITDVGIDTNMQTADIIASHCKKEPQLVLIHVKAGRFSHPVERCKAFIPNPELDRTEDEIKAHGRQLLDEATIDFETWVSALKFAESLLE